MIDALGACSLCALIGLALPVHGARDFDACEAAALGSGGNARFDQFEPKANTFLGPLFYNGALLREFFGPMKNTFRDWITALESDQPFTVPENGLGLYLGHNNPILAKYMEYPIDAGIAQFAMEDFNKKRIIPLVEFRNEDIRTMHGSSAEAKAARARLMEKLDLHLLGIYGALDNSTHDMRLITSIRGEPGLDASLYENVLFDATPNWMGNFALPPEAPPLTNLFADLQEVVDLVHWDKDNIIIKVDLARQPKNRSQEVIQQMFFITHWQMVQKFYREWGLLPDKLDSAFYLLNDFIKIMEETGKQNQLFLMYPLEAWDSIVFRIKHAHKYISARMTGAGYQPYRYQTIGDAFTPFYPTYGMIAEKLGDNNYELKRLFHNSNPDPLKMLRWGEKKAHKHYFYHYLGAALPVGAKFTASSGTRLHTRLYESIGFHKVSSEFSPQWGVEVVTLEVTREEYLNKTRPPPESP